MDRRPAWPRRGRPPTTFPFAFSSQNARRFRSPDRVDRGATPPRRRHAAGNRWSDLTATGPRAIVARLARQTRPGAAVRHGRFVDVADHPLRGRPTTVAHYHRVSRGFCGPRWPITLPVRTPAPARPSPLIRVTPTNVRSVHQSGKRAARCATAFLAGCPGWPSGVIEKAIRAPRALAYWRQQGTGSKLLLGVEVAAWRRALTLSEVHPRRPSCSGRARGVGIRPCAPLRRGQPADPETRWFAEAGPRASPGETSCLTFSR